MTAITETAVPIASRLHARLAGAHYHDCYCMTLASDDRPVLAIFLAGVARTPGWINRLMALRNAIVARLGLKNLGPLNNVDPAKAADAYRPGDRVGIFTLLHVSHDEVVLGDSDRHLDVQVSVCRLGTDGDGRLAVSTVVHVHRLLGRLYMLPVAPLHRMIVPAVMKRLRGPA